jgi:segregation and condensation protein B
MEELEPQPQSTTPEPEPESEPGPAGERDSGRALPQTVSIEEWMASGEPGVEEAPQAESLEDAQLLAVLEACVYVAEEPLMPAQIAATLNQNPERIRTLLQQLVVEFDRPEHGVSIKEVAGGYKMATKAEHHDAVRNFVKSLKGPPKLSLPALETLAVVAYKQPVTSPEIMEIRGVQGGGVLKTLLERKLIAEAGRKNVIGKPILYKTTKEFLIQFGLKDLAELPSLKEFEEIRRMAMADSEIPAEAPVAEQSELHLQAVPASGDAPSTGVAPDAEAVVADAPSVETEAIAADDEAAIAESSAVETDAGTPESEASTQDAEAAVTESPAVETEAATPESEAPDAEAVTAESPAVETESAATGPKASTPDVEAVIAESPIAQTVAVTLESEASASDSEAVIAKSPAAQTVAATPESKAATPDVEAVIAGSPTAHTEAATPKSGAPDTEAVIAESPAAHTEAATPESHASAPDAESPALETEATAPASAAIPPPAASPAESQDH